MNENQNEKLIKHENPLTLLTQENVTVIQKDSRYNDGEIKEISQELWEAMPDRLKQKYGVIKMEKTTI